MIQRMMCVFFTFLLGCFSLSAVQLQFKPGNEASYFFRQWIKGEKNFCGDETIFAWGLEADIDLKIESVNDGPSIYPIQVELRLSNIKYLSEIKRGITYIKSAFDSTNPQEALCDDAVKLNNLNTTYHFKIDGDFKITELTNHIANFYLNDDSSSSADSDSPDMAASENDLDKDEVCLFLPWTFELFLTQVFHLADQDLHAGQSYEVDCYPLDCLEDVRCKLEEKTLTQHSAYQIEQIQPHKIFAVWKGNAQIKDNYWEDSLSKVFVKTKKEWDTENSLIQKNHCEFTLKDNSTFLFFNTSVKVNGFQTWFAR